MKIRYPILITSIILIMILAGCASPIGQARAFTVQEGSEDFDNALQVGEWILDIQPENIVLSDANPTQTVTVKLKQVPPKSSLSTDELYTLNKKLILIIDTVEGDIFYFDKSFYIIDKMADGWERELLTFDGPYFKLGGLVSGNLKLKETANGALIKGGTSSFTVSLEDVEAGQTEVRVAVYFYRLNFDGKTSGRIRKGWALTSLKVGKV